MIEMRQAYPKLGTVYVIVATYSRGIAMDSAFDFLLLPPPTGKEKRNIMHDSESCKTDKLALKCGTM